MRTKESEIQANIQFWARRGIELSESEARSAIEALQEVEEFDYFLVMPKGITVSQLWEMMGKEMKVDTSFENEIKFRFIPRESTHTYAVATRDRQEADYYCPQFDSFCHHNSSLDWEKTAVQFMTLPEYMIMAMRYFEETGNHLDEKGSTSFPRLRMTTGHVPEMGYSYGRSVIDSIGAQYFYGVGVREVVAEGTPQTEEIPYNPNAPFCL